MLREVAVLDTVQTLVPRCRPVWSATLAATIVAFAPLALAAQKWTDPTMPLPPGTIRERGLEPAAAAGEGPDGAMFQVYRVGAPVEMLLGWYQRRLSPTADAVQDTARLKPGDVTLIRYHLTYHSFDDQCADSAASASAPNDAAPACKRWRRGVDKRRALDNSRIGFGGGKWIERFTLTWFSRGDKGELVRRQIEVRDTGMSDNWQHDRLRSQITLERGVVGQ